MNNVGGSDPSASATATTLPIEPPEAIACALPMDLPKKLFTSIGSPLTVVVCNLAYTKEDSIRTSAPLTIEPLLKI